MLSTTTVDETDSHDADPSPDRRPEAETNIFLGAGFNKERDLLVDGANSTCRVVDVPPIGKGLQAMRDLEEGEFIFSMAYGRIGDALQTGREAIWGYPHSVVINVSNDTRKRITSEISEEAALKLKKYLDPTPDSPLRFCNHDCDPSCHRKDVYGVVAARKIRKGEALTMDYSTLETNKLWRMACKCDSPNCRQQIGAIESLSLKQVAPYWRGLPLFMKQIYAASLFAKMDHSQAQQIIAALDSR